MSDSKTGKPLTLKGILALAAAGVIALVANLFGIDLTGGDKGAADETGARANPTAPAETGTRQPAAPAKESASPPKAAPSAPPKAAPEKSQPAAPAKRDDTKLIQQLFRTMVSDRIVEAEGEIVHILPLDTVGSRHQNFLVELSNGITLKVSHNIDLAPQIPNLRKGTSIRFHGEYEWNDKGGVVHWTHHDPRGRHEGGWLEYAGQRYE